MKTILLTGGNGMVGRNVLEHHATNNFSILAPSSKHLDLTDFDVVQQYIIQHQPDFIIHAAGKVGGIQANIEHPVDFLVTNTDIARNIILAAKVAGTKHFLNIASSCMYPRNAANPLEEKCLLHGQMEPTNEGYALAKIYSTRLCQYINQEETKPRFKTLIPCNLYGRYDKFNPEKSHLIPAIIHKISEAKKNGSDTIKIWGDGKARREFMYAGDLADAIMYAINHFSDLPEVMNIGMGHDHTINEYYETIASVMDWHGNFIHDLDKPVGMQQKLVSIKKQTRFGWKPSMSLEDGLRYTIEYYRNFSQ